MAEIFKETKDVELFLKNLHIEYSFSCYSEKNPQGKVTNFIFEFRIILFKLILILIINRLPFIRRLHFTN